MRRTLALAAAVFMVGAVAANAAPSPRTGAEAFARRLVAKLNERPVPEDWGVPDTAAWYDPAWLKLMTDNETLSTARGVGLATTSAAASATANIPASATRSRP